MHNVVQGDFMPINECRICGAKMKREAMVGGDVYTCHYDNHFYAHLYYGGLLRMFKLAVIDVNEKLYLKVNFDSKSSEVWTFDSISKRNVINSVVNLSSYDEEYLRNKIKAMLVIS